MTMRLRVNPIDCVAHGLCGELLPEAIRLDEWGYPIIEGELTPELHDHARRAASDGCTGDGGQPTGGAGGRPRGSGAALVAGKPTGRMTVRWS
jgi:ferredoxin